MKSRMEFSPKHKQERTIMAERIGGMPPKGVSPLTPSQEPAPLKTSFSIETVKNKNHKKNTVIRQTAAISVAA